LQGWRSQKSPSCCASVAALCNENPLKTTPRLADAT
jgi:hypothetical protein